MPDIKKVVKKLVNVIKDDDALKLQYYIQKYNLNIVRIKLIPHGHNLLHVACKYLAMNVVDFLMNKRRLLTQEDRRGRVPVHILIEKLSSASSRKRASFADVLSRMQRDTANLSPLFEGPFTQFNSFFENPSPSFSHMFPSMTPMFNAFRTTAFQRLNDFCQHFDPRRDSDETWASKLAEEMQAEQNEEWGRCTCENDEPRQETYDEWTSRIFNEYHRKHGHHSSSSTSNQHSRTFTADDQRKFEEAERDLQRLRKEKLKRKEKKNYMTQKKAYEMVCYRIKFAPSENEAQQSIIKPSRLPELVVQPSAENIRNVFFCDIKESNDKRKYVKEQMKIWHPDKFLHKIRNCVAEKHVPEIEEIAKRFCQFLTELLADIE